MMSTTAPKPATTPIPVQLSEHEFETFIPTASFNSLSNVLVLKGVVTARSWLTEGTLQWSWDPCPLPPQVIELSVVKLRSENYFLLQKLFP